MCALKTYRLIVKLDQTLFKKIAPAKFDKDILTFVDRQPNVLTVAAVATCVVKSIVTK